MKYSPSKLALTALVLGALTAGCGSTAQGFTAADKQQVQKKTDDLQKSVDSLGSDLGKCAQDAVTSLISGDATNVQKCVTTQLNVRTDQANSLGELASKFAPKANGQCAKELDSLGTLANSMDSTITKVVNSFSNGFDVKEAQNVVAEVATLIDGAKQAWSRVSSSCSTS